MAEDVPRLFLISPPLSAAAPFVPALEAALEAGDVACVLVRLEPLATSDVKKLVGALAPLAQKHDAAVLLEDLALAARTDADGVHVSGVGEELAAAVAALKPDRIVGVGALRSRHEAMIAGEAGVDYVMFGGASEPARSAEILELTDWWAAIFTLPCVAYAGTLEEVAPLVEAGADFIALADAVWGHPQGAGAAVEAAMAALALARERIA
jgi:thiamine-phosphate pyrophosphorylase